MNVEADEEQKQKQKKKRAVKENMGRKCGSTDDNDND